MLETERLVLKLMDGEDEQEIVKWRNRKEIIDNLFTNKGITLSQHRNWFESYIKTNSRIEFVITKKEDNKKIGTIGLSSIDCKNQKAEYGILIGEKDERGKGYAKEASFGIVKYGFEELNLQKIYLKAFSDNINAINLYIKLGFKQEGVLKREIFKNGKFKDVIIMAIFKDSGNKEYV